MPTPRASSPETARASGHGAPLAPEARLLHRSLIEAVLATGTVPSAREFAARLGTTDASVRSGLDTLAAADYVAFDASGQVSCLYPFSTTPTAHAVVIDGQRRFAMCAIDALGISAMLGQELAIEGRCAVCHAPIRFRVRPGSVVSTTPATAQVVARRDHAEPAFAACCPFTVFACGHEHAEQFTRRISGTRVLTPAAALSEAEQIFAGLLAETIPATRPRGKRWGPSRDA